LSNSRAGFIACHPPALRRSFSVIGIAVTGEQRRPSGAFAKLRALPHPSARVDADLMSTTDVPSNTYTKNYVEVARAAGRGCNFSLLLLPNDTVCPSDLCTVSRQLSVLGGKVLRKNFIAFHASFRLGRLTPDVFDRKSRTRLAD
jgi:hypothetical protein